MQLFSCIFHLFWVFLRIIINRIIRRLTTYYLLLTLAHLPVSAFADEKHETGQFDRSGFQENL